MIILGYALASVWLLPFLFSVSELLFKHSLYLSRKVIDCIVITWVGFYSIPQTIQPTTSPCQAQPQPPTAVLQSKTSPYTTSLRHVLKTDKNVFVVSAILSQPGWTVSYIRWIYLIYLFSKEPMQSILEMARFNQNATVLLVQMVTLVVQHSTVASHSGLECVTTLLPSPVGTKVKTSTEKAFSAILCSSINVKMQLILIKLLLPSHPHYSL